MKKYKAMTTLERVQQLDDFKALRLFRHIEGEMVLKVKEDLGVIMDHLPENVKHMEAIQNLEDVDQNKFLEPIEQQKAVEIAKVSLAYMAEDPGLEPYLKDKLENWKDNEMVAGTILAVGGALSAVMIMSTFRVSYNKADGWDFSIGAAKDQQSETIKTIFEALFRVLKPG